MSDRDVPHFLNRELLPLLRELLRALQSGPVLFPWASGAGTVDVRSSQMFAADDTLSQNSTLTLTNGQDGCEGWLFVQQDASGGWTLSVTADGRTILREDPFLDDNPDPAPDSITRYHYLYATVNGVPYVVLERLVLL